MLVALAVPAVTRADNAAKADGIKVDVTGFRNGKGQLGCSLFNGPDGFPRDNSKIYKRVFVPIKDGHGECVFSGIPAGDYAVTIFHDEDSSRKFKMNFVGYPLEGYGFSNNVVPQFKAPSFDETKFQYDGKNVKRVPITLIYR